MIPNLRVSERAETVPQSPIREMFNIAQDLEDVINLGIGEPDFDTPEPIRQAAKESIDRGYTHYTSNAGLAELRCALAEKLLKENGICVEPKSEIIVTVGAMGALSLAMLTLIDPGDKVLVPNPGWPNYYAQVAISGGTPVAIRLKEEDDYMMTAQTLEENIDSKTRLVVINSPANPTGSVQTKENLEGIAEIARKYDIIVLSDESYEKLIYDGMQHYSIASFKDMKDRTVTIGSFSKTYAMTGWRIGYAGANRTIIKHMVKLQESLVAHPCSIAQRAALAALENSRVSTEMVNEFRNRRDLIVELLNDVEGIKCSKPKGAFYVFPNISELNESSYDLAMMLLRKARVVTIPGIGFGSFGEGHLRLSYAISRNRIVEAVSRIKNALTRS